MESSKRSGLGPSRLRSSRFTRFFFSVSFIQIVYLTPLSKWNPYNLPTKVNVAGPPPSSLLLFLSDIQAMVVVVVTAPQLPLMASIPPTSTAPLRSFSLARLLIAMMLTLVSMLLVSSTPLDR